MHDLYDVKDLRITPFGWINDLVFETKGISACGDTKHGMGIRINDEAGGVLGVEQMLQIRDVINIHLKKIYEMGEKPESLETKEK